MEYLQYVDVKGSDGITLMGNVLNLVISGIPSILAKSSVQLYKDGVLNLVISGIPSIRRRDGC